MAVTPRVVVVGLGPGDVDLLTVAARRAIDTATRRFVRTTRHPSAAAVGDATAFDDVYEGATTLDEVYPAIAERLVAAAAEAGEVLYAVPGSPLVAERTVELLRADPRVEVVVHPAVSFLDLAWARLGVDPVAAGVRVVDGHRFAVEAAGSSGPLLVAQCDSAMVLSDVKLCLDEGPDVVVLSRLGLPDEAVTTVAWADLDRSVTADHLTSVWIPALADPVAGEVARFVDLVRTLRERCPWDRRQTHASLTRHLLEETYEVLEAIDELDRGEGYGHLEEELGDLLFQVVFHATLAAEQGAFTMAEVATGIHDKLVRRHPHVFGGPTVGMGWEQIKAAEKGRRSVMDGLPGNLPGLLHAHKVQGRASSIGFDWGNGAEALPKVFEEADELRRAISSPDGGDAVEELGDLLFAVVGVARLCDIDPEAALRSASDKFRRRFAVVEAAASAADHPLTRAEMEVLWERAKAG